MAATVLSGLGFGAPAALIAALASSGWRKRRAFYSIFASFLVASLGVFRQKLSTHDRKCFAGSR
jgi:hypothetical protein